MSNINQLVQEELSPVQEEKEKSKSAKKIADKASAVGAAAVGGAVYGGVKAGQYAVKKFKNWRAEKATQKSKIITKEK